MIERILERLGLAGVKKIYTKYKEQISYLFWGVMTTVVNWLVYFPLTTIARVNHHAANLLAWVISVLFAFFVNRRFVFCSEKSSLKDIVKEGAAFFAGRLASLGMEELILLLGIDVLHVDQNVIKIISNIFVIIANYVISKWIVFRKKEN